MNSIYEIAQCNKECKKVKTATKEHYSKHVCTSAVKDACILSLQFSKITKPITTSLVKNEYENKCTGSLISLLSSSEKFQNYCVSSQTKQTIWCFFQSPSETSAYLHGTLLQRTFLRWRFFLCILCKLVWVRLSLGIIKNFNKMPRLDRRNDTQIH